ncbi:autoinducer binding domain-containing protein, partial [Cribrihabitans sp. XS_ASV171]
MSLREYLHFLSYVTTLEELWDAHTRRMAELGFDRLLYGYTQYRTATSLGDPEDFVILTNHERTYVDGFVASGLYSHAPMLR